MDTGQTWKLSMAYQEGSGNKFSWSCGLWYVPVNISLPTLLPHCVLDLQIPVWDRYSTVCLDAVS